MGSKIFFGFADNGKSALKAGCIVLDGNADSLHTNRPAWFRKETILLFEP